MTDLVDRYIATVLRSIPEDRRSDVDLELRASIEEDIDARISTGEGVEAATRAALTELGDPDALAAEFAGKPLYLLSPPYFLSWRRTLKSLLSLIPGIVAILVVVLDMVGGGHLVGAVMSGIWAGLFAALNVVVWVTVGYIVAERVESSEAVSVSEWTLDDLPSVPDRQFSIGEVVASIVIMVVLFAAIFYQRGLEIPFFDPVAWDLAIPVILVLLGVSILFEIAKLVVGQWTLGMALANTALQVGYAAWWARYLLTGELLNEAFFENLEVLGGVTVAAQITAGVVVLACAWDIFEGWRGYLANRSR